MERKTLIPLTGKRREHLVIINIYQGEDLVDFECDLKESPEFEVVL
jgi:hypothetical protein